MAAGVLAGHGGGVSGARCAGSERLSPLAGDPRAAPHIDDEVMTSPMEEFLAELGRRGSEPLLASASGTIRFDVHRGGRTEHWVVRIDRGKIAVSHGKSRADAIVDADVEMLDRIATGEMNATAAVLRGALHVEGDPELLIQLQRAFPGPSAPVPRVGHMPTKNAGTPKPDISAKPDTSAKPAKKAAPKPVQKAPVKKAAKRAATR